MEFEVFLPKQVKTLMEIQPDIDPNSTLEFMNLGTVPLQLAISNSSSDWNPLGTVLTIPLIIYLQACIF